jgi:hypothetical protein
MPVKKLLLLLPALLLTTALADEGMWMPQQVPALGSRLAALGFQGDPKAFADLTGQPMGAVVSLGGCSASFISPDGLMVTNHHCTIGALQFNSTPERNLLKAGFLARSRDEELWNGPGSKAFVTVQVAEVTAEITAGLDAARDDLARALLIERRVKARTAACERGGLRCTVASFFEGARWFEIGQLELQDLRLVFAPPSGVGNFGGETDNWIWPRHTGDFSMYRAYVAPGGKPAPWAKENVPYRPARWLEVSPQGASEGDLVIVAGYPGRTARLQPASQVKEQLEWSYPRTVRRNTELLALLDRLSAASRETAIRVNPRVRGLANSMKKAKGVLEGARRTGLLATRMATERALLAWIAADPKRQARYGEALPKLEALQQAREQTRERDATFSALYAQSALLGAARTGLRLAAERAKPDVEREAEFQQRNWARLREGMERLEKSYDPVADRALLRHALLEAAALPAGQRIPPLDIAAGLAAGQEPAAVAMAIDAFLDRLYAGTRLGEQAVRLALLEKAPAEAAPGDSFVGLAIALEPFDRLVREADKTRAGARSRYAPVYAAALLEKAGGPVAPDANSTLRVTYGTVRGVSPRDGVVYTAQTRLAGVLEKDRPGDREFDVPAPLRELLKATPDRSAHRFADKRLGDVPIDFLSTVDTTGGNSGSAVLDARGRLCGLLFDGTYESVASDLLYDPVTTRSIQVDSRYLLWYLEEVARADHLLAELKLGKGAAK